MQNNFGNGAGLSASAISLCLAILTILASPGLCEITGGFVSPDGCTPPNCDYTFKWVLNVSTDVIAFTVTGKQALGTWVAVGFGVVQQMMNQDTYYGYIDPATGIGFVYDGYVGTLHSTPMRDESSNLLSKNITYTNGIYTMTFERKRHNSGDGQDVSFSDAQNIYIKYPVGGGPMSGTTMMMHFSRPLISPSAVCICQTNSGVSGAMPDTTTGMLMEKSSAMPNAAMTSGMLMEKSSAMPNAAMTSGMPMGPGMTSGMPMGPMTSGMPMGPMTSGMPMGPMTSGMPMGPMTSGMPMGPMTSGMPMGPMTSGMPMGPMTSGMPMGPMTSGMPMGPGMSSGMPMGPGMSSGMPMGPGMSSGMPMGSTPGGGNPQGSTENPGSSGSSSTKRTVLLSTLIVFGCLGALVVVVACLCVSAAPAASSAYSRYY